MAQCLHTVRDVSAGPELPPERCLVLNCQGDVTTSQTNSRKWEVAKPDQILLVGDKLRTGPESRAAVLFSDLSVLRVNELTLLSVLPPPQANKKPLLDLKVGSVYFFSREKPAQIEFHTPTVSGAIRGTEFELSVSENGETALSLIDGVVDLENEAGRVRLTSGEQGHVVQGQAPAKTALIEAINVIQWCLYYPAVMDVDELDLTSNEKLVLGASIQAYRAGDLPGALAAFPQNTQLSSDPVIIYRAALALSVGNVIEADEMLNRVDGSSRWKFSGGSIQCHRSGQLHMG
jgi:hypothetical protein